MSNLSKYPRIQGEEAFKEGKSIKDNPYGTSLSNTQAYDWDSGYRFRKEFMGWFEGIKTLAPSERYLSKKTEEEYIKHFKDGDSVDIVWRELIWPEF